VQNVAQVALEAGNSPKVIFSNYRELVRVAAAAAGAQKSSVTAVRVTRIPAGVFVMYMMLLLIYIAGSKKMPLSDSMGPRTLLILNFADLLYL